MRTKQEVAVSPDLVIFESGQVTGPNAGGSLESLQGSVDGTREVIRLVTEALARDASTPEFIQDLESRFDQERVVWRGGGRAVPMKAMQFRGLAHRARRSRESLLAEIERLKGQRPLTFFR